MNFAFSQNYQRIDWRKLAFVDIQTIVNDVDLQILEDNLANISLCDIEEEMADCPVNGRFTNLFKMAQLIIQYLMFTQQVLANQVKELTKNVKSTVKENQAKPDRNNENSRSSSNEETGRSKQVAQEEKVQNEVRRQHANKDNKDNQVNMVKQDILKRVKESKDSITSMAMKLDHMISNENTENRVSPTESVINDNNLEMSNSLERYDVHLLNTGSFTTSSISPSTTVKRDLAERMQRRRIFERTVQENDRNLMLT